MEDIGALLGSFLSQPDSMEKLSGVLAALGGAATGEPPLATPPAGAAPPVDLAALSHILPALGGAGGNDTHIALLRALKPYLHDGREKRVDEAIDMLRLAKLLPLLTNRQGG